MKRLADCQMTKNRLSALVIRGKKHHDFYASVEVRAMRGNGGGDDGNFQFLMPLLSRGWVKL